ncbi:copper resistance protein B [Sphingobium yanoikuyae]|jgi:copper resistance protein B|uniref:Copper resistance protein B n=1 Tax=Sphingobium yanoikuyae TaxID=13690 RepID=A0A0J9FTG2_SPHYA|nr:MULTISPECIES: copper resistance protein B [Sphingobium]ATP18232.1 copper resistance protein B [Sphingobium yanoikuyae]KMW31500.1 copper resistance protein CopB [Sphingobium yanoikuyae]MDH2130019.1 copper resistance protein B [Sphingobium yanoikuyae]MDH2149909.1 copper resistance protein B [Sphingobium yanoikuyae]MDH2165282.1 copper resistance protein B [Sphingobium yanoikuyae]
MKLIALLLLAAAAPVQAQTMDHSQMDHGAMGHSMPTTDAAIPQGTAPPVPTDHAADALYDPAAMASARAAMIAEGGGMTYSQWMLDRLEYRAGKGADGYAWEGEGWIGGDINRFAVKSEGEGTVGGSLERAEVQALYSRAIDPWFNLQAGVRQDFGEGPDRSYAVIGIDGLAPYWFEVGAEAFLSTRGDAHLRLEASYDQRITQRLILQPAAEFNLAAQAVPELGIGAGPSDIELGLRLRYEIAREFAPYVGVNWERKLGDTADHARAAGDRPSATSLVIGLRAWF